MAVSDGESRPIRKVKDMKRIGAGFWKALYISLFALCVDQISKVLVSTGMRLHQSTKIIGDLFQLTYIHNPRGVFGLPLGGMLLQTIFSFVAIVLLLYALYRASEAKFSVRLSLAMILGGALGNFIDRVRMGEVVDFLDFGVGGVRWPIFNAADIWVTVGAILLAFHCVVQKDIENDEGDAALRPGGDEGADPA